MYPSQHACRRVADRAQFRKCAGCAFVLYCSTSCQREDWRSHRNACKTVQCNDYCRAYHAGGSWSVPLTMFPFPVDIIRDEFNRFPRRVATVHINRQWNQIVALAQTKNIPLSDVAVEITCTNFPPEINVFDYHELLEGTEQESHLAMVANEILRRPETDRHGSLMAVLCVPQIRIPCIV